MNLWFRYVRVIAAFYSYMITVIKLIDAYIKI